MISNKLTRIFDNIGFNFTIDNDNIKQLSKIKTYNILNADHVGYIIPYIARNLNNQLFETGIGEVSFGDDGNIIVKRLEVISSSDKNASIIFPSSGNEFYIFANQSSFDKALNNTVVLDQSCSLDPVSALYLVDSSSGSVNLILPESSLCTNLIIEFKLIESSHNLNIYSHDNRLITILDNRNDYSRLASNGQDWVVLNKSDSVKVSSQSLSGDNSFSMLSDPSGDDYSLQYKNASSFAGSKVYWDPVSSGLLFGANSLSSAKHSITTVNNQNISFNKDGNGGDFIVYGSGLNKNLFFAYDGRIGINIPTGTRPSTVFHIVNTICSEALRIENRTSCNTPATVTLLHKPSGQITNNSVVSQINLTAANNLGNIATYSNIESRAINTLANNVKGSIDIRVFYGPTGIKTIESTPDSTYVGYSGNKIEINNNGNLIIGNNTNGIVVTPQSTTSLLSSSIFSTGTSYLDKIVSVNISGNNFYTPNLSAGNLLTIANGKITNSSIKTNSIGSIDLPISGNKILSTTAQGSITGIYSLDDYFLTENDINWSKFPVRTADICLRQITFTSVVDSSEFSEGDQIVIISNNNNFYRKILNVELNGNNISGLLIDEVIAAESIFNIEVYSISKGGYLTLNRSVDEGTTSDATENVLSNRPLVDTVFNNKQKDINFIVYGLDEDPALLIKANTGRVLKTSGIYSSFATTKSDMFPIIVNSSGSGISKTYSSANYNYNLSTNLFSGILSDIGSNGLPSYYGTYDQNGNAAEWVDKVSVIDSRDSTEFAAGGSYITEDDASIGPSGLKSMENLSRASGYAHVGFRVASLYGITDAASVSSVNNLNFNFITVSNPGNVKDSNPFYIKNSNGYSLLPINNLGVVSNSYRISKYEVTNNQYCKFLNAVDTDTVISKQLYHSGMSGVIGGIDRVNDGSEYVYTVKNMMANKPVVFASYINSIKFINWLHHGAPNTFTGGSSNIDFVLNNGAYNIYNIDTNSYIITKASNGKYSLPDINQWHKAAYYQPIMASQAVGTSSVSIKRSEPYLVGSGIDVVTQQETQTFANLSVSGWLYADHIMIGDGTIMSSLSALNFQQGPTPGTPTADTAGTIPSNQTPNVNLDTQWNNVNTKTILSTIVSCTGCVFNANPLRLSEDTYGTCSDTNLLAENNIPWWCDDKNVGPGWFI